MSVGFQSGPDPFGLLSCTHDTTLGKMPLVCGVVRDKKTPVTMIVTTAITAMKILVSLMPEG
jgi:hypothetical protein